MYKNRYYYDRNVTRLVASTFFILAGMITLGHVLLRLLYWVFLTVVGILFLVIGVRLRRTRPFGSSHF